MFFFLHCVIVEFSNIKATDILKNCCVCVCIFFKKSQNFLSEKKNEGRIQLFPTNNFCIWIEGQFKKNNVLTHTYGPRPKYRYFWLKKKLIFCSNISYIIPIEKQGLKIIGSSSSSVLFFRFNHFLQETVSLFWFNIVGLFLRMKKVFFVFLVNIFLWMIHSI